MRKTENIIRETFGLIQDKDYIYMVVVRLGNNNMSLVTDRDEDEHQTSRRERILGKGRRIRIGEK